jgi:glutaredoxin
MDVFAQQVPKQNLSKQIPPFQITQSDGSIYRWTQLAKAPVVIIYFSPDCHHCVDFSRHLFNNFDRISNKQIVMVTYQDISMLKEFDIKFNTKHYPTLKTGTEGRTLAVQRYYGVMQFPFVALHNSTGQLVKTFEGEQPFPEILKAIQQLK